MVRLSLYLGEGGRHCPVCLIFGLWLRELREHDESCCSLGHHLICWDVIRSFRYRFMPPILTFWRFTDWMIDHISITLCFKIFTCCQYHHFSELFQSISHFPDSRFKHPIKAECLFEQRGMSDVLLIQNIGFSGSFNLRSVKRVHQWQQASRICLKPHPLFHRESLIS